MMPIGNSSVKILNEIKESCLDLLFPQKCINCGQEGKWLCQNCQKLVYFSYSHNCPICQKYQSNDFVCLDCVDKSFLNGLWVLADYNNKLTKKIVQLIKYNFLLDLEIALERIIKGYFSQNIKWPNEAILLPVPLSRRRFLSRGFNQAELICQLLQKVQGNNINNQILTRTIYRRPQTGLSIKDRQRNIRNNFKIRKNFTSKDRNIILVDDVYTTGATMNECAKVLKENGFTNIWGLVIARG